MARRCLVFASIALAGLALGAGTAWADGPGNATEAAKSWYVLARLVDYAGTTLFFGGLLFLALLWPQGAGDSRTRRLLVVGWLAGAFGSLAGLLLDGAWVAGTGPEQALRLQVVSQVLNVPFGRVWAARLLLWVLAAVVLADLLQRKDRAARSAAWRVGLGAVGFGVLRTSGMTGHSSDATARALAQIADLVHLVGICAWVGGLAVLLFGVLPRRRHAELAAVLPRYSRLAQVSVLLVVAAGAVLAWQVVGSVHALLTSDYGHLLLIKIGLLCLVLLVAVASKRWVDRRLDFAVALRGDAATVRPFVYSVTAETTLVVLVLAAASFLVTASPGR
jgi:copper transport protein